MVVITAGVVAAIAVQTTKFWKRYHEDHEKWGHEAVQKRVLKYAHEKVACLIDYKYDVDESGDKPKQPITSPECLGYEVLEGDDLARHLGGVKHDVERCMVFKRVGDEDIGGEGYCISVNEAGHVEDKIVKSPDYIVVVGGTIPSKGKDLRACGHILFEKMCKLTKLSEPLKKLLSDLHKKAPGPHGVWVGGHSAGATLCLLATRKLALEDGIVLYPFLFNLPYMSLDAAGSKAVIGIADGLGDIAKKFPGIGDNAREGIRRIGKSSAKTVEGYLEKLESSFLEDTKKCILIQKELRMRKFRPHVFVNPKDPVCNGFIEHFQLDISQRPVTSLSAPLFQLTRSWMGSEPERCFDSSYLIPEAILHISDFCKGPWHAHKCLQWFKYESVKLTSKLYL